MKKPAPPPPPSAPAFLLRHRMARALEHSGLSISGIAADLRVSRSTISNWLHGRAEPRAIYLDRWADLTNVDRAWLLGELEAAAS